MTGAFNSTISKDISKLNKSTTLTPEMGFGLKLTVKLGPLEAHAGLSIHDEKTFHVGEDDKKGDPIKDKAEVDAGLKLGPVGRGGEWGYEHTDGTAWTKYQTPDSSIESAGGLKASAGGDKLSFGVTGYGIIGGGITETFEKAPFMSLINDLYSAVQH
jgi:hypothetical protein